MLRVPWRRVPRLPDGDLPETIDAGEARDALLTHGRADLAIALLLPADAEEACRRGHGLLAAAARLAGTGGDRGGDYRRALGGVPPLTVAAIARAGAWLSACGRAGYTVRANLSDAAANNPHPPSVADPARAREDTPSGAPPPRPAPSPSVPTTTGEARALSPSTSEEGMIIAAAGEDAPSHRAVVMTSKAPGEDDGAAGDPGEPPAPGPDAVYIADPTRYYVSDPAPGGAQPSQVPAYFTDWLSDELATGTDGYGGKP